MQVAGARRLRRTATGGRFEGANVEQFVRVEAFKRTFGATLFAGVVRAARS